MDGQLLDRAQSVRSAAAAAAAVALSIFAVVAPELAIVGLVAGLGPIAAFAVLTIACTALSWLIAYAFDADKRGGALPRVVVRTRAWIERHRERAERRAGQLARFSQAVAFVALSATAGPFITTVAVKLSGGGQPTDRILAMCSSALFSAIWVVAYAGGLAAVGRVFGWD